MSGNAGQTALGIKGFRESPREIWAIFYFKNFSRDRGSRDSADQGIGGSSKWMRESNPVGGSRDRSRDQGIKKSRGDRSGDQGIKESVSYKGSRDRNIWGIKGSRDQGIRQGIRGSGDRAISGHLHAGMGWLGICNMGAKNRRKKFFYPDLDVGCRVGCRVPPASRFRSGRAFTLVWRARSGQNYAGPVGSGLCYSADFARISPKIARKKFFECPRPDSPTEPDAAPILALIGVLIHSPILPKRRADRMPIWAQQRRTNEEN